MSSVANGTFAGVYVETAGQRQPIGDCGGPAGAVGPTQSLLMLLPAHLHARRTKSNCSKNKLRSWLGVSDNAVTLYLGDCEGIDRTRRRPPSWYEPGRPKDICRSGRSKCALKGNSSMFKGILLLFAILILAGSRGTPGSGPIHCRRYNRRTRGQHSCLRRIGHKRFWRSRYRRAAHSCDHTRTLRRLCRHIRERDRHRLAAVCHGARQAGRRPGPQPCPGRRRRRCQRPIHHWVRLSCRRSLAALRVGGCRRQHRKRPGRDGGFLCRRTARRCTAAHVDTHRRTGCHPDCHGHYTLHLWHATDTPASTATPIPTATPRSYSDTDVHADVHAACHDARHAGSDCAAKCNDCRHGNGSRRRRSIEMPIPPLSPPSTN